MTVTRLRLDERGKVVFERKTYAKESPISLAGREPSIGVSSSRVPFGDLPRRAGATQEKP